MPKYEIILYWNQPDEAFIARVTTSGCREAESPCKQTRQRINHLSGLARDRHRPPHPTRGRLTFA